MTALIAGVLLLADVVMLMFAPTAARAQVGVEDPGVIGYVLALDGTPVSGGTVVARSGMAASTVSIESTGRFRVVPGRSGVNQFVVSVPGFAPFRFTVTVPPSKSLRLPVIRLSSGATFRVRLVLANGEPILAPQLRRRLFEPTGRPIDDVTSEQLPDPRDNDGAVTIGPLVRGIMTLAIDMPLFAQTRLPDVNVQDPTKDLDGGTVVIQQPGAVLNVDVTDGAGAPVSNHDVFIEDPRPRSPLGFRQERTNPQGRVTFDRLAAGQYRVSTPALDRCGSGPSVLVARVVPVSANGTIEAPFAIGGHATFRITSPLGPARAAAISAAPNVPPQPLPLPFRAPRSGCLGATDSDGRVTLTIFPPGPAHVDVHMANSTYTRQVEVPLDGREVAVAIPDGLLPVRVVNEANEPVSGAIVTWTGSGGRVEATTTATGDALLEGVGTTNGTLGVSSQRYQSAEETLAEPPGILHTIVLKRLPRPSALRVRVTTAAGEALRNGVVEFSSTDPAALPRIVQTDGSGLVRFDEVPPGPGQLTVSADGFVTSTMRVAPDATGEMLFTLSRGYRAIADVQLPMTAGSQLIRVLDENNRSMDAVLDAISDRRVEPPARLSLGPLAPGMYILEVQSAGGRRQERIRIVDRDVYATLR